MAAIQIRKFMDTNTLFQNGTTLLHADFHLHIKTDIGFACNVEGEQFFVRIPRILHD